MNSTENPKLPQTPPNSPKKDFWSTEFVGLITTLAVNSITLFVILGRLDSHQGEELQKVAAEMTTAIGVIVSNTVGYFSFSRNRAQVKQSEQATEQARHRARRVRSARRQRVVKTTIEEEPPTPPDSEQSSG
jgi:hypothetical protein